MRRRNLSQCQTLSQVFARRMRVTSGVGVHCLQHLKDSTLHQRGYTLSIVKSPYAVPVEAVCLFGPPVKMKLTRFALSSGVKPTEAIWH